MAYLAGLHQVGKSLQVALLGDMEKQLVGYKR